jgi:hypothetical protein
MNIASLLFACLWTLAACTDVKSKTFSQNAHRALLNPLPQHNLVLWEILPRLFNRLLSPELEYELLYWQYSVPDMPQCRLKISALDRSYFNNHNFEFQFNLICPTQYGDKECIEAEGTNSEPEVYIALLRGKTKGCPSGKQSLKSFEAIARHMGYSKLSLVDCSSLPLFPGSSVSLRSSIVTLINKKKNPREALDYSYYAQSGFHFASGTPEKYLSSLRYLNNIRFSDVLEQLNESQYAKELLATIQNNHCHRNWKVIPWIRKRLSSLGDRQDVEQVAKLVLGSSWAERKAIEGGTGIAAAIDVLSIGYDMIKTIN